MILLLYLYGNLTVMILEADKIENEVIRIIEEICTKLKIEVKVDSEFCPGNFIKSQVLLTFISVIEDNLELVIPNECYIFCDKDQRQLTIRETSQKIINVVKKTKQNSNV
ncbi:hypothetical protein IRZ71_22660 [Flavobacterium sp. ANB]|uniref:hypothetical protein n=1 Tax=Flavobacterium sp. ANB TaxID=2783790 RepID=UPI00188BC6AD|nr:hypothetical protein [Flavobacterium sp. ANB]MBF4519165.1 hypothetical protein [Flavobacterium sp. ANB]